MGNNFARRADIPRQHVVAKRHHPYGSVFLRGPQPVGEGGEANGRAAAQCVSMAKLSMRRVYSALRRRENLQQRHRKARPFRDELFHLGYGPAHYLRRFDGFGPFRGGEKLAGMPDSPISSSGRTISNSTSLPSFGYVRDLHRALDHQIDLSWAYASGSINHLSVCHIPWFWRSVNALMTSSKRVDVVSR